MRKIYVLLFVFLWTNNINAQQDNKPSFARQIKVTAADSLLSMKEMLKTQLQKNIGNKKQNSPLRLLVTGNNKTAGSTISRWMAAKMQQDLYRVDLAAAVSKYAGETEKNLEQLFVRAEEKNWILFFDEADALFGNRSNENAANSNTAAFIKYCNAFKGIVIIACKKENCTVTAAALPAKFSIITAE